MNERLSFGEMPSGLLESLRNVDTWLRKGPIDGGLLSLIKTRVSQINQCVFCIDMHWREAREAGDRALRLARLSAWREAPDFTARERAALALADGLTSLPDGVDLDALWREAEAHFESGEIAMVALAIAETNAWNRLSRACGFALAPVAA